MDFIPGLPKTEAGFDNILVVVDKLSKFAIFIPTTVTVSRIETARLIFQHVISTFGLPRQVISDRDSRWAHEFWEEICRQCDIKRALTTAYHPQADGQTEIMNQILETGLRCYVSADLNDWDKYLDQFALSYNSTPHTATGYAPAELLFGFTPTTASKLVPKLGQPPEESLTPNAGDRDKITDLSADELLQRLEAHRRQAKDCLIFTQVRQQRAVNKHRIPIEFEVGDLVVINQHSLQLLRSESDKGKKLKLKYDGPFEIQDKLSPVTYRLRMSSNYLMHPVLNIEHLEAYKPSPEHIGPRVTRGVKRDTQHEPKHEAEILAILDDRLIRSGKDRLKREYLIQFVGESENEAEWKLESHINAPELMRAYSSQKRSQRRK